MNYYEKHVGDWIKDTVSLDMTEDGAYNRLVDQCYQSEKPLPADIKEVYRLARANKPAERKAVDYVLAKFFDKGANGYTQKRVQAEIARYSDKQAKARASADARWNKVKSHSEGNANASDSHDADGMRTHSEGNALQTPDTIQIPSEGKPSAGKPASELTKEELWKAGKSLLSASGVPKDQCGSFVGKLVKDYGDEVVIEAVRAAVVTSPADPKEYLKAACQRKAGERGATRRRPNGNPTTTELMEGAL